MFHREPCLCSLRYPRLAPLNSPRPDTAVSGQSCVGPVNDLTFLDYPRQIDPHLCGPFDSERDFMEAIAFLGKPPTRAGGKFKCGVFEKTLEIYDVVERLYRSSENSSTESCIFHFAHGDLSDCNVLIDPDTGAVIGD